MKWLRTSLDRVEPLFQKGGKLERLYPLYEANDTFLYTPGFVTKSPTHVRDSLDMKRMMSMVVVALVPCTLMAMYNTGYQANLALSLSDTAIPDTGWRETIFLALGLTHSPDSFLSCFLYGALWFLPIYITTLAVGGICEAVFAVVRGHEINEGFLVTSLLYPLTLPPGIPLWQVGIGIVFGVVIGKEIFGGTGKNFLNPALTARAFLFFAYPSELSGDKVWTAVDGFTSATTLTGMSTAIPGTIPAEASTLKFSFMDCFLGFIPGSMGETSTLCCLFGAAILIATGVGSWRIMAGMVAGATAFSALLWAFHTGSENPMMWISPWWHLVIGGFAFGTVFMATDPVSAAMTESGKWIYGLLVGFMAILIRVLNPAFPEGVMLAILFGNVMAPLIDYFVIQANVKRRLAGYGT